MNDAALSGDQPRAGSYTRRGVVASLLLAGVTPLTASANERQQTSATPEATATALPELGEASMPQWRFIVSEVVDPYAGTLTKPPSVPAGIRVIGIQVVLLNESDQPLDYSVTDFRLRDADGTEYRAGDYQGTEPRIVSQNLPDGERTRGWVWFGIPESAQVASMVFIAPAPVLQVSIA